MDRSLALLWAYALILLAATTQLVMAQQCQGSFRTMGDIGISPITVSQSRDGLIYLMDRSDLQNSKLRMRDGSFAHAVEYTVKRNTWRGISTATNTWCSAGGYLSDGTILNTAGNDKGFTAVRLLRPCSTRFRPNSTHPLVCNQWWEDKSKISLAAKRWYPTSCALPDGRHIVVGGSTGNTSSEAIVPNFEFVDPTNVGSRRLYDMPFLRKAIPNYLYPFVHLLPSNLLFVFANVEGILLDYNTNRVIREIPKIPDENSRSYPCTAASVLMPLDHTNAYTTAEVLICGGNKVHANKDSPATNSCWLADVGKDNVTWKGPYNLARGRVMPDMLYLMDGTILVINGAQTGVAGFKAAKDPNFWPEILQKNAEGFTIRSADLCPSPIARGYHSSALLIQDGRVLLSGSNPFPKYVDNAIYGFRTEYRVEMYSPPYLSQPRIALSNVPHRISYRKTFNVSVLFPEIPVPPPSTVDVRCAFISNAFTTHSLSMNLRYINVPFVIVGEAQNYTVSITAPPSTVVAPGGPYMLAVTYKNIPAWAQWMTIK